jgi:two-component system alkaline phosphatase synthesis response regulator PhoP
LTAKDSTQDKITGLKKGGDDYMTKPFHLEEFLLRVRVLLRHSVKGTTEESNLRTYQFGKNEINFVTYKATTPNGEIDLTRKETKLLKLLIERNNEVVSREHILQFVWGYDVFPSTRTIDNFILAFRKYFEDDPKEPIYFHSVRGVGYKFTNPGN